MSFQAHETDKTVKIRKSCTVIEYRIKGYANDIFTRRFSVPIRCLSTCNAKDKKLRVWRSCSRDLRFAVRKTEDKSRVKKQIT